MNATETDCGTPCAGDSTEMCGSSLRLNLYWNSSATPQPPPTMVNGSSDGLWNLMGCYKYAIIAFSSFFRNGFVTFCVFEVTRIVRGFCRNQPMSLVVSSIQVSKLVLRRAMTLVSPWQVWNGRRSVVRTLVFSLR